MASAKTIPIPTDPAERHRQRMAARSRDVYRDVADIGPIPKCENRRRRSRYEKSLERWLRYYLAEAFPEPFSADHQTIIHTIEQVVATGGQFLNIVFRGFGKSTIVEGSALFAGVTGQRRFIMPIGAEKTAATTMLDSIKSEIEENYRLLADYPEVCFPVRCLEGKNQRTASQHSQGRRTRMKWVGDHIVLPQVADSRSAGVIIKPVGIGGAIRGSRFKDATGRQLRPDFVPIDDIQTDKSAKSAAMTKERLDVVRKTVFRLGGHKKRIACVINGTIIEPDDAIDQLSDHKRFPSLQVQRIPMVRHWSACHDDLWLTDYANLRNSFVPDDKADRTRAIHAANTFYKQNRKRMDAGCLVSWKHCHNEDELSAVQHAYNILIDDGEEVFQSECQNDPLRETGDLELLTAGMVTAKIGGYPRGVVTLETHKLTAFIDVQGSLLYYVVVAWTEDFSGFVVDYGSYPDQHKRWFRLRGARQTLQRLHGKQTEAAIFAGLKELTADLLARQWRVDDGSTLPVSRCLIDAQWGDTTELIDSFCRQSIHAAVLMPSHGLSVPASKSPIAEWRGGAARRKGLEWLVSRSAKRRVKSIKFNTNYWKRQVYEALLLPIAAPGSLVLFKTAPENHRMFAEHAVSENPKRTQCDERIVYEWPLKPNEENHLWDCLVGCAVGASEQGITRPEHRPSSRATKKRSLAALQARKRSR